MSESSEQEVALSADGEVDEVDDMAGNRAVGAIPRAVLEHIARSIVDDPDAVVVEVDEVDDMAGNRAVGAIPRAVLEHIARSIVDDPDAVVVEVDEARHGVNLRLHVAPDDMGRIIGRRGRVAQAIRTLVRAAGANEGIEASVDIVD